MKHISSPASRHHAFTQLCSQERTFGLLETIHTCPRCAGVVSFLNGIYSASAHIRVAIHISAYVYSALQVRQARTSFLYNHDRRNEARPAPRVHPQTSMTLPDACLCMSALYKPRVTGTCIPVHHYAHRGQHGQTGRAWNTATDHALTYLYRRDTGLVCLCFGSHSRHTI